MQCIYTQPSLQSLFLLSQFFCEPVWQQYNQKVTYATVLLIKKSTPKSEGQPSICSKYTGKLRVSTAMAIEIWTQSHQALFSVTNLEKDIGEGSKGARKNTPSATSVFTTEKNEGIFCWEQFLRHIPETARDSMDTLSFGFTQTKNAAPPGCYGGSDMNNWKGQKKALAAIKLICMEWNSSTSQPLLMSRMAEFPVKTLV